MRLIVLVAAVAVGAGLWWQRREARRDADLLLWVAATEPRPR